jgi:prepilin-type processing-associated H-X9-DG protein/prepilin-type N-terminal cleavage/methylation domain-containing protein
LSETARLVIGRAGRRCRHFEDYDKFPIHANFSRLQRVHCLITPACSGYQLFAFQIKPTHHRILMNITPPCKIRHRVPNRGLTLIEILVVITIIVVIAALSTLGFSRVRSAARGANCVSNLRQVGGAMLAYAVDNSGQLPPLEDRTAANDGLKAIWPRLVATGGYLDLVPNSLGKASCGAGVWACPDCTIVQTNYNGYGAAEGTVMQVKKGSVPNSGSLRLAQIPNPERTWLVGDAANKANDLETGWYAVWANPTNWKSAHVPAARHGGKVNVCMVDGHVESLSMKELTASDKDYTMFKK